MSKLTKLFKEQAANVQLADVQAILDSDPEDVKTATEDGMYPLHHGFENNVPAESIAAMCAAYPEAASKVDEDGR